MITSTERAVLAGGCFWGMQDLIRRKPGVVSTRVGYTGGDVPNATYLNHGTHAEAIEIVFDPEKISYRELLEFFFQVHDPTTLNRQGNDRGMSYRSAIFFHQRRTEARGGRDYRGRQCLQPLAWKGCDGGRTGWRLLGGGAGTPGLLATESEGVYVPFRASKLEAPEGPSATRLNPFGIGIQ